MKIYISGDRRQRNAFANAVVKLRDKGYDPVNPLTYPAGDNIASSTASHIVRLFACDAVYLLPSGENSSRSKVECQVAFQSGKPVIYGKEQLNDIQTALLGVTNVHWDDIAGVCRDPICVYTRIIFAHHAYYGCGCMKKVANILNRSRTTIKHYLRKYNELMDDGSQFRTLADRMVCRLDESAGF